MFYIKKKYTFIIHIMKIFLFEQNQGSQPKFSKQKVWGKRKLAYTKHIKIQSCHMGIIFTPKHMTWHRQKRVQTHSLTMHYHTGNVYLRCCDKFPSNNIPDQETDNQYPNTSPSIRFHIYHMIAHCKNMTGFH